jgi:2',3'-cyclic-nucleotide 2'-phosphodiesterase (5'-nucleotidase family)
MSLTSISRRRLLQLLGTTAVLTTLPLPSLAQATPTARLIVLSDLHSAYERTAQLYAAVAAEVGAAPAAILINGDIFESGNVVSKRSEGVIDWTFLGKLAKLAPTVLNIGNHEPDLINDLAEVVTKAKALGVTVVSNIGDTRTGAPFTEAAAKLEVGGLPIALVGIATPAAGTYPKATRELMAIPDPVEWANANLAANLAEGSLHVVLSHAGVVADKSILPLLADGTLVVGGHDHLTFEHSEGATRYVHTGSWSSLFTVVDIAADRALSLRQVPVALDGAADAELAALIAETMKTHLTAEELAVIGQSPEAQSLGQSARFAAASLAAAGAGDVGFIGHTTFGTGLPKGDVTKFVFDSVVRFDGKLMQAQVDRATLDAILTRCNQDGDIPLANRTGDFLYASPIELADKAAYTLVCNDWSATNQKSYFGREDLAFTEIPDLKVKATVAKALS